MRTFDPAKSRDGKASLAAAMAEALSEPGKLEFPTGCLEVVITAALPCPKGEFRVRTPRPTRWRDKRPDIENFAKLILDAATGIWWTDDAQVARLVVNKLTVAQGSSPYTEVMARPLGDFS